MSTPVGVVVIDDNRVFLETICFVLRRRPEFRVLGAARNGPTGLHLLSSVQADVAVVDVRMPGMHGPEATRAIKERAPDLPVIALTVSPDEEDLSDMLRAGACSYVLKPNAREELPLALLAASRREAWLSPVMTQKLIKSYLHSPPITVRDALDRWEDLTSRERSVLAYLAQGRTNREISENLCIAETTVKSHLKSIFGKLKVRNRSEAAAFAWQIGLPQTAEGAQETPVTAQLSNASGVIPA